MGNIQIGSSINIPFGPGRKFSDMFDLSINMLGNI